jgi:flagellar L-ring protein precursor FlgH
MLKTRIIIAAAISTVLLTGCNTPPKRDPQYAPARPVAPAPTPVGNGSIYQAGYGMSWFEDLRAKRVGDLLTVKLVEKTSGEKESTTTVEKDNTNTIANPTIFGTTPSARMPQIPLISRSNETLSLQNSTSSSHSFEGSSDSSLSNKLSGEITVTVVELLPNGNMKIRGEKRLGINEGNEYIRLSGIVRSVDIDTSNTVLSTKVADPTIIYVGDGATGAANKVGWLAKFFISALMPF